MTNAKLAKTASALLRFSFGLFQNVIERIRLCCATMMTNPPRNPIEKAVENRFITKVPITAIESWTITVQEAARIRASEFPALCKLRTILIQHPITRDPIRMDEGG